MPETCVRVSAGVREEEGADHVDLNNLPVASACALVESEEDAECAGESAAAEVCEKVEREGGCGHARKHLQHGQCAGPR